jgi:LmbE family N-acetylglucosaminyl deacetylase
LVIAPHPDDEILGCGGVIARHVAHGDQVTVLIMTKGAPDLFTPELVDLTRREARSAHAALGVTSARLLDFPAPRLDMVAEHELADAIRESVQAVRPTQVYLPHRGDLHVDHRMIYRATLVACRPINSSPVQRLLSYETLSETEWAPPAGDDAFIPTVYVDISRFLALKLAALECYQSQLKSPPHPRSLRSVEALARMRGAAVSLPAAEAFMLVREVIA